MFNLLNRSIIIILLVLFGFSFSSPVFALELDYPSWFPIKEGMRLSELVLALFNVFLVVAGAVSFLMLVVGGIRYLTAFGSAGKLSEAREQIISVLIGFTVLLSSFLLLKYLNPQLLELREPTQPPLKPVVMAGPDKITVRVELDTPEETKFEYSFSKDVAETVVVATIDSRKLNLNFNPANESFTLCFEGSQPVAWRSIRPFDFIAGCYALAQSEVCFWTKAQVVSGSDALDWQEEGVPEPITFKGMITIAVGLSTPPPRQFGYLDYVPLGKDVERTSQFFATNFGEQTKKKVLDWLKDFRNKTIERSKSNCTGATCSSHYKTCVETCSPPWCVEPVPPVIVCPPSGCVVVDPGNPGVPCDDGCCPPGWQPQNNTCQAGTCNDANPSHTPCAEKDAEITRVAGLKTGDTALLTDDLELGELGKTIKKLEDPDFKNVFNKGLNQITNCISQEGYVFLSCEDAEIWLDVDTGEPRLLKDINGQDLWPCQQGHDFICTWVDEEVEYAQKIVFPLEYLKEGSKAVQELGLALYSDWKDNPAFPFLSFCKCDNINSFCDPGFPAPPPAVKDQTCSPSDIDFPPPKSAPCNCAPSDKNCPDVPCSAVFPCEAGSNCSNVCVAPATNLEAPFPDGFKAVAEQAIKTACQVGGVLTAEKCDVDVFFVMPEPVIDSIVTASAVLQKDLDTISAWSAVEQIDTCYEVKSLLKSYLESGDVADCPPTDIYPCCPPQILTQAGYADFTEQIKDCSDSDFFYCNPPSTSQPPDVVVPPGGNCSGTGNPCAESLPNQICGAVDPKDECDRSAVNQWDDEIRLGIDESVPICGNIDPVRMLKAVMANESDGNLNVGLSSADCVGLFQLSQHEVDRFRTKCGIPSDIDVYDTWWFAKTENVDEQACVAAEIFRDLAATSPCGCDVRQLAAGYNGGAGVCQLSENCNCEVPPGEDCLENEACQMCLGQTTRVWECLWDDDEHSTCNTGYTETRGYAPKVEYCYGVF